MLWEWCPKTQLEWLSSLLKNFYSAVNFTAIHPSVLELTARTYFA